MSFIDMSAAEAISRALNSAPNARIDPKLWLEFSRVHSALKETAALADAVNNPAQSSYGGVPVHMYLQDQTIVTVKAGMNLVSNRPVRFELSGGELKAFYAGYGGVNTRVDAVHVVEGASSPSILLAGDFGRFILRGLVIVGHITIAGIPLSSSLAGYKSQVYNFYYPSPNECYFTCNGINALGHPLPAAGRFIHYFGSTAYGPNTILMYLNPNRSQIDLAV